MKKEGRDREHALTRQERGMKRIEGIARFRKFLYALMVESGTFLGVNGGNLILI